MLNWFILVPSIGLLLSLYALRVERYAGHKKGYHPACDFNNRVSCTKALTSKYGKTLKISNAAWGMIFYSVVIILIFFEEIQYVLILALISLIGSVYLAYFQYIKLRTFCMVCTAIYIINIALALLSYYMLF